MWPFLELFFGEVLQFSWQIVTFLKHALPLTHGNSYPGVFSYSQNLEVEVTNGDILEAGGCCPGFIDFTFRGLWEVCRTDITNMFCPGNVSLHGSSKSLVGVCLSPAARSAKVHQQGSTSYRNALCGLCAGPRLPNVGCRASLTVST